MPAIARMLERVSGKMPDMAIAPDQIVAHGAAIHASLTSLRERASTPVAGGGRRLDSESAVADSTEEESRRLQAIFEPAVVDQFGRVFWGSIATFPALKASTSSWVKPILAKHPIWLQKL